MYKLYYNENGKELVYTAKAHWVDATQTFGRVFDTDSDLRRVLARNDYFLESSCNRNGFYNITVKTIDGLEVPVANFIIKGSFYKKIYDGIKEYKRFCAKYHAGEWAWTPYMDRFVNGIKSRIVIYNTLFNENEEVEFDTDV